MPYNLKINDRLFAVFRQPDCFTLLLYSVTKKAQTVAIKKPPGINRTAVMLYRCLETHLIFELVLEIFDLDTHLLHRITLAHSHSAVFLRVEIVSHAERCADLVLTAVALADIAAVIVIAVVDRKSVV